VKNIPANFVRPPKLILSPNGYEALPPNVEFAVKKFSDLPLPIITAHWAILQ